MFVETAEFYDLVYRQFKDYPEESRRVAALLRRVHPRAATVLDVACGTGEHARILSEVHGYAVDGLDLEPAFVEIARRKNPDGEFVQADMTDFDLGRRYDAVLCLFSSIGYVRTLENVRRALERFREHLDVGGVVVVEPWLGPDEFRAGSVSVHTAETEDVKICRMSHSDVRGRLSLLEFRYLIGHAAGIEQRHELHELGLFTVDEMAECFARAGLEVVEYDHDGLIGRGLFIARAAD